MTRRSKMWLGGISLCGALALWVLPQNAPGLDWKALQEAWTAYSQGPGAETLNRVLQLLPEKRKAPNSSSDGATAVSFILNNIAVLETQLVERNPAAVRLAFRLFSVSFGDFEIKLAKLLGTSIGFDPLLFLQELALNRDLVPDLELVLASFQLGSQPGDSAREMERKYRLHVLEGIELKDKNLKSLRNECLKILKQAKTP